MSARGERFQTLIGGDKPEPKWAALRRAVRAVLDAHDRHHERWYTYAEVGAFGSGKGEQTTRSWPSDATARDAYNGAERNSSGELYVALFDAGDPTWPDPIFHLYRAPSDAIAVSGPVTMPSQIDGGLAGRYRVVVRDGDRVVPISATDDLADAKRAWASSDGGQSPVVFDTKTGRNVWPQSTPSSGPVDPYAVAVAPMLRKPVPQLRDPALDYLADLLFWHRHRYKPNHKLDMRDPMDRAMVPFWNAAREEIARTTTRESRRRSLASDLAFRTDAAFPFVVIAQEPSGELSTRAALTLEAADGYARSRFGTTPYLAFFARQAPSWPAPDYETGSDVDAPPGDPGRPPSGLPDRPPSGPPLVASSGSMAGMDDENTNPTGIISGHRGYAAPSRGRAHGYGPHYWRAPFRDRLAHLAPIAYPAAGGAGVQFKLDGDMLVASICVDGRCYEGRYDLAELLARRGVDSFEAPTDPQTANDAALEIQAAGDTLVGALLDDHVDAVIGGWWDDLSGAVSSTVKSLAGPIRSAAKMAIPAIASLVPGGALVAPLATNLVDNMMAQATGTPQQQAAAKANVAQVQQRAAAGDQTAKKALRIAKRTLAKSSTTYHAAQTATNAASGNPDAQAQVAELHAAAAQGDQSAATFANLIRQLTGALTASSVAPGGQPANPAPWTPDAGDGVGGAGGAGTDVIAAAARDGAVSPTDPSATVASVSGVATTGRQAASAAAVDLHRRTPGAPAIGVVFQSNGAHVALPLESLDAADDWMGQLEGGTFTYAAYFDPKDPTWPAPINERVGAKVVSAGWLAPVLAAAGGFGLGAAGWPWLYGKFSSWGHPAPAPTGAPAGPQATPGPQR